MSGVVIGCLPDPPPPPPKADAFLTIPSLTFALTTGGDTFLMATGAGAVEAGGLVASVSEEEVEEVEEVEGCLPNRGGGGGRTEGEEGEEVGVLVVVEGGDTIPGRKLKIYFICFDAIVENRAISGERGNDIFADSSICVLYMGNRFNPGRFVGTHALGKGKQIHPLIAIGGQT